MNNKFKLEFPQVIRIEPAATCNLACIHCPTGTYGNPITGVMTMETFEKIKEEISHHHIRVVVLYMGGEPFINKNFFLMVDELKKIGIPFIKTVSNGMLLNKKKISAILGSGLDLIEFSLDGTSPEMSELIRKNSKTNKIVNNIKELLDEKALRKSNLKVNISSAQFKHLDENNNLKSTVSKWLNIEFKDYIDNGLVNINYVDAYAWSDMKLDPNIFYVYEDKDDSETNYCDHIVNTITIRSNGDVVPCCYDLTSKLNMGNIHIDKIEDIWNNKKYVNLRKSIDEKNFYSICKSCSVVTKNKFLILKEDNINVKA